MLQTEKQNNLCDNLSHVLLIASLNRPKPLTDQETESGGNDTCILLDLSNPKRSAAEICIFVFIYFYLYLFLKKTI